MTWGRQGSSVVRKAWILSCWDWQHLFQLATANCQKMVTQYMAPNDCDVNDTLKGVQFKGYSLCGGKKRDVFTFQLTETLGDCRENEVLLRYMGKQKPQKGYDRWENGKCYCRPRKERMVPFYLHTAQSNLVHPFCETFSQIWLDPVGLRPTWELGMWADAGFIQT